MTGVTRPLPALIVLAGGTLTTVAAELLPAGLLPSVASDLDVSDGAAGALVTVWGLAIAALSLPLTRATRRIERRRLLAATLAFTGIATLLGAFAPSFGLLVAARVVAAAGHGLFWAQVVVVASGLAGERNAARGVAIVVAGPTIAQVAVVPALTVLGEQTGWRVAFGVVGGLILTSAALVRRVLPTIAPAPAAAPDGRARDSGARRVLVAAGCGAVLLTAHFMAFTFVASVVAGRHGLAPGVALLVFGVAGVAGLAAAPVVVRLLPRTALPVVGAALAASLLLVVAAGASTAGTACAVAAWGLVVGALPVVYQTRVLALAPEASRASAGALSVVALNLGVALGAAAGGAVHDGLGAEALVPVAAAVAAIGAAALFATARPDRRAARRKSPPST